MLANKYDLSAASHIPELHSLTYKLLRPDPKERLSALETLAHPFFWPAQVLMLLMAILQFVQRTINFLMAASDRMEIEKPTLQ